MLENVSFMLQLHGGRAMKLLVEAFEERGYRWAYRVVNSQSFVPQRRERVLFVATKTEIDPASVLLTEGSWLRVRGRGAVRARGYDGSGAEPEGWASRVAAAAARWNTGLVVAEANNGGAMVESVLKAADYGLRVRLVHASRGKCARAEPIALKFETGKAFFAGEFPELEAELGGMVAGGGYEGPGRSPDRADAMVWAMTVLSETRSGVPRVRRL